MRKNLRASIDKPLKLGLLILLISFFSIIGSAETSYAVSSKTLVSTAVLPTVPDILPTPKSRLTPTPNPKPKPRLTPTPAVTQPPQATLTAQPQVSSVPTNTVLPNLPVMAPPPAVPTATAVVSTTPTTVAATPGTTKSTLPFSMTPPSLKNVTGQGFDALTIFLVLGVGAPLLLIGGGGTLWSLMNRNRVRPVRSEVVHQADSWANSYAQQFPLYALQSTSDLMPLAQASGASGASSKPPAPSVQPTYTASKLRPVTIAFPPQMLVMNSSEGVGYALNNDLQIGSLDLSLNTNRAIEANGNGQMPLRLASPTALVDMPTSSMPSSPPVSSALAAAGP